MDKWTDLVKARMRELKVTQETLAERIGVTQGAVGHWLREEREPKLRVLNQILVEVGLPPLQMVFPHQVAENNGSYTVLGNPATVAGADGLQHELYFRYPVLAWGNLDAPTEDCPLQSTDYKAEGRAFWLRVEGDAMTAPLGLSVPEGMLILIDAGLEAETGKLVIARSPGSTAVSFRQLSEEGGQRYLRPLNPTYPKALCTEQCELLGVVVQALMKF
ncbi:LexA family protein [Pseudomonas rubra]|uniref:Helix-turn-helix domain-containing protein n=1 Tax=Pseudomonas rubra TaxID=2942627 RepID=A0ABT5PA26_9PSED|nr:LexA family transcriptional regulator [Pseudomonas rubra]MDD1015128.1 helix-turn-helix domain-containing protein [Pseudomonas rubra]MDD1037707.1 helix-turn-helix domain-containing protein [Pseudomonas rubra]MDD1157373.1 helix-turn-helix domain-containing protein [Pseudomonas rubra]